MIFAVEPFGFNFVFKRRVSPACRVTFFLLRLIFFAFNSLTLIFQVTFLPLAIRAVILVFPFFFGVTLPSGETVATFGLLEVQVIFSFALDGVNFTFNFNAFPVVAAVIFFVFFVFLMVFAVLTTCSTFPPAEDDAPLLEFPCAPEPEAAVTVTLQLENVCP